MKKLVQCLIIFTFLSTAVLAQGLPRIAVYVTGDAYGNEKSALRTRMLTSLINTGRYRGIERADEFLAEIEQEHIRQRSGAIDEHQIRELGKQFGVTYICIAAITPAFGSHQVSARIVDVETAEVIRIADAISPLRTMSDLTEVSERLIKCMLGLAGPRDCIPRPPSPPRNSSFWLGVGLEIIGGGLLAYGLYENRNVDNYIRSHEWNNAKNAITNRDIFYIVGTTVLLSGIAIHILF
jgi:hypothetical protein